MNTHSSDRKGPIHAKSAKRRSTHLHGKQNLVHHHIRMPLLFVGVTIAMVSATRRRAPNINCYDQKPSYYTRDVNKRNYKEVKKSEFKGPISYVRGGFMTYHVIDVDPLKNGASKQSQWEIIEDYVLYGKTEGILKTIKYETTDENISNMDPVIFWWFGDWARAIKQGQAIIFTFYCNGENLKVPMYLTIQRNEIKLDSAAKKRDSDSGEEHMLYTAEMDIKMKPRSQSKIDKHRNSNSDIDLRKCLRITAYDYAHSWEMHIGDYSNLWIRDDGTEDPKGWSRKEKRIHVFDKKKTPELAKDLNSQFWEANPPTYTPEEDTPFDSQSPGQPFDQRQASSRTSPSYGQPAEKGHHHQRQHGPSKNPFKHRGHQTPVRPLMEQVLAHPHTSNRSQHYQYPTPIQSSEGPLCIAAGGQLFKVKSKRRATHNGVEGHWVICLRLPYGTEMPPVFVPLDPKYDDDQHIQPITHASAPPPPGTHASAQYYNVIPRQPPYNVMAGGAAAGVPIQFPGGQYAGMVPHQYAGHVQMPKQPTYDSSSEPSPFGNSF